MRLIPVIVISLVLLGCGKHVKQISLLATTEINLDEEGNGAPVDVAMYFLSDTVAIAAATFSEIWNGDRQPELGQVRPPTVLTFWPGGEPQTVELPSDAKKQGIKFVGFAGRFREHEAACWKSWYPIADVKEKLQVTLTGSCIEVQNEAAHKQRPERTD